MAAGLSLAGSYAKAEQIGDPWLQAQDIIDRLATPPSFLFAVAAVPFFASAISSLNPAFCALYVLIFFLCLGELIYAMSIHTRVLKEIAESGGNDDGI